MKVTRLILTGTVLLWNASQAFAVSDGNYDPARQHCSGRANNSDNPTYTEPHCHSLTVTVRDGNADSYHEYFGFGFQQVAVGQDGGHAHVPFLGIGDHQLIDVWYDLGTADGCQLYTIDNEAPQNYTGPFPCNFVAGGSTAGPNPAGGLHLYFGEDDNTDNGEHDSSSQVNNGPSDGGGWQVNLDPLSLMQWLADVQTFGAKQILRHPLPIADAGLGFCADGICMSTQTTQRQHAYSGGQSTDRGVANYGGKQWDPQGCSGATGDDTFAKCGAPPGYSPSSTPLADWNSYRGDPTVDPGIQIYEDPDAQGSPIGPYPLPGIYVGTCGVVISDPTGQVTFPASQFTNASNQIVIDTGCHAGGLLY